MADDKVEGRAVDELPLIFKWSPIWQPVLDYQVDEIQAELRAAKDSDQLVVYLSCPISGRGGGDPATNVDVARFVERRLRAKWGGGVHFLNTAEYQMQTADGKERMKQLLERKGHKVGLDVLMKTKLEGGDFMRMWARVLVENPAPLGRRPLPEKLRNTGQYFDAYYFVGPTDVQEMFLSMGGTVMEGIRNYFDREFAHNPEFRARYSVDDASRPASERPDELKREDFVRYYALRAGANFSLGSHDERLIFRLLNAKRRELGVPGSELEKSNDAGIAGQISGFFDGRQIDPSASELAISSGNAKVDL